MNARNSSGLYVAKFANGVLKPEQGDGVIFGNFEETALPPDKKKRKRLLVAETAGRTYVGQNYGAFTPSSSENCRYMIGVVDKKTGKMTVHDAQLMHMKPHTGEEEEEEEKKDLTFVEKSDMLTAAFGSSKKKRAMDSRHKNKLTADKLKDAVDTAVDKTLIRPDVEQVLKVTTPDKDTRDIPPHNKDATRAADVYPLSGIINDAELQVMQSPASVFVSCTRDTINEWQKEEKYPNVVLRHLRVLPIQEKARMHKSSCLMYLTFMIHLYKRTAKDLRSKDLFPGLNVPSLVEKSLLKRFTLQPEGSRIKTIPARLKDKLVCYILVLCLILDEFNMEYSSLMEDLMISKNKMFTFLRALGCQVSNIKRKIGTQDVSTGVATLPTPLTFPEIRPKKTNKRQK